MTPLPAEEGGVGRAWAVLVFKRGDGVRRSTTSPAKLEESGLPYDAVPIFFHRLSSAEEGHFQPHLRRRELFVAWPLPASVACFLCCGRGAGAVDALTADGLGGRPRLRVGIQPSAVHQRQPRLFGSRCLIMCVRSVVVLFRVLGHSEQSSLSVRVVAMAVDGEGRLTD